VTPSPSGGSVNATSIAQAVWSYSPRSLTDIQNLVNAIQNNNPSLLSTLSDLQYVPAPYYTGQVTVDQVAAFISNLVQNYNAAGLIANFINNNPYNLWNIDFVVNLIQDPYLGFTNAAMILSLASTSVLANIAINTNVSATTLYQLISNAALSASAAQGLLYGLANNYYFDKWIQVVTCCAASTTFSTNAPVGYYMMIAPNITIASGVTVTLTNSSVFFFVAQSFNNYGTISGVYGQIYPYAGGGGYGNGGYGIVIIAITTVVGTIEVPGSTGGASTTSSEGASPPLSYNGTYMVVSGVNIPLGGTGAPGTGTNGGLPGPNGGGGGGGSASSGGTGGSANLMVFPNGNALLAYLLQSISDWWLLYVIDNPPYTITELPNLYGSSGGEGGGSSSGQYGGGGGGGGGGEVIIYGDSVIAGNIYANGGPGGTGGLDGSYIGGGGGGGGGGVILVFYGPGGLSGTMYYNVAPGPGGVGSTSSLNGLPGQTGVYLATSVIVNG
jgi:hypothetical protein